MGNIYQHEVSLTSPLSAEITRLKMSIIFVTWVHLIDIKSAHLDTVQSLMDDFEDLTDTGIKLPDFVIRRHIFQE